MAEPKQFRVWVILVVYFWILAAALTILRVWDADPAVLLLAVFGLILAFTISNALIAFSHRVSSVKALILVAVSACVAILAYAGLYTNARVGLYDARTGKEIHDFLVSLYFSVITFCSVGYGDVEPLATDVSRLLAATEALFGYIYLGLTLGICMQVKDWSRKP